MANGKIAPASNPPFLYVERFMKLPVLDADITPGTPGSPSNAELGDLLGASNTILPVDLQGTNSTAFVADGGGILTTTGTNTSDSRVYVPRETILGSTLEGSILGTLQFRPDNDPRFETRILGGTSIETDATLWHGFKLTNTPTLATDADQAYFTVVNGAITLNYSVGGTDYTQAINSSTTATGFNRKSNLPSNLTFSGGDEYTFTVRIIDRIPYFYVNPGNGSDLLVGWGSNQMTAAAALIPVFGIQTDSDAARTATHRYVSLYARY